MKQRYLAYIRVSTSKQGELGSSLVEQKASIEAYAARNGLTISRWFEEMETAARRGRTQFSLVLKELSAGRADGLIVHKIDRGARNLRDWADLGELVDSGVDIRFVSDNFDLMSRGGRLSADIQAVIAADYIRNLKDEVRKGIRGRLKQGLYPFRAPHGYRDAGRGQPKAIDPVMGPIVREMFEWYATNTISLHRLRREMATKGLRTKSGQPFALNTVSLTLHNPFYIGVIRLRTSGETFVGVHEPLVSKATFDRVQAIIAGRTVPKATKHLFLFRQTIRCSLCQRRTLTGERRKGHVYYRCHLCRGWCWREERIEAALRSALSQITLSEKGLGDLGDLVRNYFAGQRAKTQDHKTARLLRLKNVDAKLSKLADLLVEGGIDQQTYHAKREQLNLDRCALIEELDAPEDSTPFKRAYEKFGQANAQILRYETLSDDEKREVVANVCSDLSATPKEITVSLRFPFLGLAKNRQDFSMLPISERGSEAQRVFDILLQQAVDGSEHDKEPPQRP